MLDGCCPEQAFSLLRRRLDKHEGGAVCPVPAAFTGGGRGPQTPPRASLNQQVRGVSQKLQTPSKQPRLFLRGRENAIRCWKEANEEPSLGWGGGGVDLGGSVECLSPAVVFLSRTPEQTKASYHCVSGCRQLNAHCFTKLSCCSFAANQREGEANAIPPIVWLCKEGMPMRRDKKMCAADR